MYQAAKTTVTAMPTQPWAVARPQAAESGSRRNTAHRPTQKTPSPRALSGRLARAERRPRPRRRALPGAPSVAVALVGSDPCGVLGHPPGGTGDEDPSQATAFTTAYQGNSPVSGAPGHLGHPVHRGEHRYVPIACPA